MRAGDYARVLVVGADALSTMVDWNDRATAVLFGDGAGAAVLVSREGPRGVLASLLRSSGEYWDLLYVRNRGVQTTHGRRGPARQRRRHQDEGARTLQDRGEEHGRRHAQGGRARRRALDDISLIVPHQANLRIINAVAQRLGLGADKVFTNVDRYGNTSAASVPIALDEALEAGRIRDNDLVMLNACGGGLTWGANLLRW